MNWPVWPFSCHSLWPLAAWKKAELPKWKAEQSKEGGSQGSTPIGHMAGRGPLVHVCDDPRDPLHCLLVPGLGVCRVRSQRSAAGGEGIGALLRSCLPW